MLKLIAGHRSDTRILLCPSHSGTACAMTENHRAEGRIESVRLRRMMGTGAIADSFGDVRCVQSVFVKDVMLNSRKVDGRPRKYTEVCAFLA
jgi:hypothetical protein